MLSLLCWAPWAEVGKFIEETLLFRDHLGIFGGGVGEGEGGKVGGGSWRIFDVSLWLLGFFHSFILSLGRESGVVWSSKMARPQNPHPFLSSSLHQTTHRLHSGSSFIFVFFRIGSIFSFLLLLLLFFNIRPRLDRHQLRHRRHGYICSYVLHILRTDTSSHSHLPRGVLI